MIQIKNLSCIVLVSIISLCMITADIELKEDIIKAANKVNCNIFFSLCLPKCKDYQGYNVKCSTATDSTGTLSYNKDGTSCLCMGSVKVPVNPGIPVVTPTQSIDDFRKSVLVIHNNYRKKHGAPPLQLSNELNTMAQNWAQNIAKTGNVQHSSNRNGAGENMYFEFNPAYPPTGENAVKVWYDEIMYWNFNYDADYLFPYVKNQVGHFTQVIWKSTSKLGCGRAYDGNKVYVVCNYDTGNVLNQVGKNINKPVF